MEKCPEKTFVSGGVICKDCDVGCRYCLGEMRGQCTECLESKYFEEGSCLDYCSVGYFAEEGNICRKCDSSCRSCLGESSCLECALGYFKIEG